MVEERVRNLEAQVGWLVRRVVELEGRTAGAPAAATPRRPPASGRETGAEPAAAARPAPAARAPEPAKRLPASAAEPTPSPEKDWGTALEDLVGGRVLAWIGGAAVLLGIAFLFALAISRGWIGEAVRTLLGGGASAGLLVIGVWLHERKARTDAALAATAAGIAGLFVTLAVAAQVYDLLPVPVAVGGALLVGALGTALAVRWDSRGIAALGLLGALLAPVLADAPVSGGTVALLFVAMASAVAVVVWRRWGWLSLLAFLVATPQWVAWLFSDPPLAGALLALGGFAALGVVGAVGYELRIAANRLRTSCAFLLALNAATVAAAAWFSLQALGQESVAKLFLAALACPYLAVGVRRAGLSRVSSELGLLALALGVVLADIAFALTVDGLLITAGFASSAVGFAALVRRAPGPDKGRALELGLGGHITVALLHVLPVDAPPELLTQQGALSPSAAAALAALAAGCLVSGRLADEDRRYWRAALDVAGLGAVAYLTALTLEGPWLALAWALEACLLARISAWQDEELAAGAALCFIAGTAVYGVASVVTPDSLFYGLNEPPAALIALGALALACSMCARELAGGEAWLRPALIVGALAALLYLASCAIVTPFQPSGAPADSTLLELNVRQQGQMALSVFWSLVGLGALVAGLLRDSHALRIGGLSVLFLAVAKVFMFDLATLGSIYRVVSFVGLGVLLLVGAFVWQRVRPRSLPDLRDVTEGLR